MPISGDRLPLSQIGVSPGPALLIHDHDPANKTHLLLSSLNVMTLWYIAVVAIGLARLSSVSFAKAGSWMFGVWVLFKLGSVFLLGGKM